MGNVKSFDGFIIWLPPGTDFMRFNNVIVWRESLGQFISAAQHG